MAMRRQKTRLLLFECIMLDCMKFVGWAARGWIMTWIGPCRKITEAWYRLISWMGLARFSSEKKCD